MSDEQRYLSFEDMIDLLDIQEADVTLPGWGPRPLRIRPLTVQEVSEMRRDAMVSGVMDNDRAAQLMVHKCLIAPALTDAQVRLLWTKQAGKVQALLEYLNRINGFGDEAAQADARVAAFRAES